MDIHLKATFIELVEAYDPELAESLWQEIAAAYTKRKRYYHTLQHLNNMLGQLEEVRSFIDDRETILFSLYYHDIVYNALRKDNEEKSADLAERRMKQLGREYSIYPDMVYKPGRKKVLEHFLGMERIFKTAYFFEKLEGQARENLRREMGSC